MEPGSQRARAGFLQQGRRACGQLASEPRPRAGRALNRGEQPNALQHPLRIPPSLPQPSPHLEAGCLRWPLHSGVPEGQRGRGSSEEQRQGWS